MEKTVRKEGLNQELIIRQVEGGYSNLEIAMLRNNQIEHLLPIQIQAMNGEECYLYDISGYQNLLCYYKNKEVDIFQISSVLQSVLKAMEEVKEYLLSGSRLLLTEEDVYINPDNLSVKLCYLPGYQEQSGEGMSRLVEFFMNHINHKDEASVVFVYGLYKMTKEERVSAAVLQGFLKDHARKPQEKKPDKESHPPKQPIGPLELPGTDYWEKVEQLEQKKNQYGYFIWKVAQIGTMILLGMLVGYTVIYNQLGSPSAGELKRNLGLFLLGSGFLLVSSVMTKREKREVSKASPLKRKEEKSLLIKKDEMSGQHTMVLTTESRQIPPTPVLRPIKKKSRKSIEIRKTPTVIGTLRDAVDEVIEDSSVSRMHASIEMECEECYLTDLQSTNGTSINGKPLISGSPMLLRHGDRITFGRVEYEFLYE